MTPPRDQTLLDRIATWLGVARDTAYRMWKWQENEAILVSTHSSRAWRCTVTPIKDGTEEQVKVVEISRETGVPVKDEPESYQWKPTIFTTIDEPAVPFQKDFERGHIRPADAS
jgi:hypothetical protein